MVVRRATIEHEGKMYGRHVLTGEIEVWRCASHRTGRYHWVVAKNPPQAVIDALPKQQQDEL